MSSVEFERRAEPFRGELLVHCYQMLGSVHDAEDQVQETLLRAWRAFDRFDERRASLRTWLHRIATNSCLTALTSRSRRPLPSSVAGRSHDPEQPFLPAEEGVAWLQPLPDALLGADANDPARILAARGSLRLALVAAMQLLSPRQRAMLILRDVLDFPAQAVAETLDTTVAAVNSGLQRARARLDEAVVVEDEVHEPTDAARRALLDRYISAFEDADIESLKRLLTRDVLLEMPPFLNWFVGPEDYGRFIARVFAARGRDWRMLRTAANGGPAVGAYVRGDDGRYFPHTLQVFSVSGSHFSRNVVFQDATLFDLFGLPRTLDAAPA